VALTKIECPECGAGLKSSEGFSAGEEVECPKCEASFTVEEPDAEAGDAVPKKKKKKKADKEKTYKNSPMRFAVLGVLVLVMFGLGGMLFLKMRKDRETEAENARITARNNEEQGGGAPPIVAGPNVGIGGGNKGGGGATVPPPPPPPLLPNGKLPKTEGPPKFPMQNPPGGSGASGLPFGLGGGTPASNTQEGKQLTDSLRQKLVGTWEGTAPDGTVHKVAYQADGKFTHDAGGKATNGTWQVSGLVGGKVLKINRGTAALKVAFEDDREIVHDTEIAGVSLSLKKK
jgi:uncharacterized Zn finger protein (UPF0148 family)